MVNLMEVMKGWDSEGPPSILRSQCSRDRGVSGPIEKSSLWVQPRPALHCLPEGFSNQYGWYYLFSVSVQNREKSVVVKENTNNAVTCCSAHRKVFRKWPISDSFINGKKRYTILTLITSFSLTCSVPPPLLPLSLSFFYFPSLCKHSQVIFKERTEARKCKQMDCSMQIISLVLY